MITIDKINAMIIERVRTVYPNIPFTAQEKLEEIERPAFKLIIDGLQSEKFAGNMVRRTFPVELVYFAKDKLRPKLECFDVYEKVEPALYALADKLKAELISADGVLTADFDVTQIDEITIIDEDPDSIGSGEDMEILNTEVNDQWQ